MAPSPKRPQPPPPLPPLILLLFLLLGAIETSRDVAAAAATVAAVATAEAIECDFERECPWRWNASERGFSVATQLSGADGLPEADAWERPDGHFLLLRGRRAEQREWALTSPAVAATAERDCRLVVALHMAHMRAGSVKAVVVANSTSWVAGERPGNDNRRWELFTFNLARISQEFHIILEIVTSGAAPSHVALDNITLVDCFPKLPSNGCDGPLKFRCGDNATCLERDHVCDIHEDCPEGADEAEEQCAVEYPGTQARCSFESGWCGWNSTQKKAFAWTLHRGASASNITGPIVDHTYGNSSGTYLYLNMSQSAKFADLAVVQSPIYFPPPPVVANASSPYYRTCKIRFYHHHFGRHNAELKLNLVELGERARRETTLWRSYGVRLNKWYPEAVELPKVVDRYYMRFEARRGMGALGDLALDDISMSPECFGKGILEDELGSYKYGFSYERHITRQPPHRDFANKTYYTLTPCRAKGRFGPQPADCEAPDEMASEEASAAVRGGAAVLARDPFRGVQRWTAPEGGYYTILAKGASGGSGTSGNGTSKGAVARLVVELHKGEELYVLVGQEGLPACPKLSCSANAPGQPHLTTLGVRIAAEMHPAAAAGGGGGASFVFKLNENWTGALPVLVAAGGGGLCDGCRDNGRQHGRGAEHAAAHAHAQHAAAAAEISFTDGVGGGGGGWRRPADLGPPRDVQGRALLSGGEGGKSCGREEFGTGGFGGGGSGCRGGGGGGGYAGGRSGGNSSMGEGGSSFVGAGWLGEARAAAHDGPGEVVIVPAVPGCRCDYLCAAMDEYRSVTRCLCPERWELATDSVSCVSTGDQGVPTVMMLVIAIVAVVLLFLALAAMCFCLYNRYQRKKVSLPRHQGLTGPDLQLNHIREASDHMMTEYNPNYDFGGGTYTVHDLKDIPRDQLRLVKALGQGAFGEVYQGFFRQRSGDAVEMPVAVKTLPELSTNQAETDFLMEALIMSKFNHLNIVHFIGVCFDKHPRFIVLELLAGGDLKTFLRESRPKPEEWPEDDTSVSMLSQERPSPLSMHDLLRCAVDVAQGCSYMESNRFIHRDIAARNCLLTTKGPGRVVKIADFGMARDIYRADYYRKGGKAMLPIKWMPPEAFLDGIFTSKTDVWSFGVLLWEIMSLGFMPYTGCTNREVMQLVTSGGRLESPDNCPSPLYGIMTQCWHPCPDERPTFATVRERLGYCLQDPDVVNAPLPTINRAPSTERDATIMRPPASDTECLRVQRAAADYLVPLPAPNSAGGPQVGPAVGSVAPAAHIACAPNSPGRLLASPSTSSVDKLLGGSNDWETSFVLPESHSTQPLLDADGGTSSVHGSPARAAYTPACAPAPTPAPSPAPAPSAAPTPPPPLAPDPESIELPSAPASPGRNHNNNNNNSSNHNNNTTSSVADLPPLAPPAAFKAPLSLDAASLIGKGPLSYVNVNVTPTHAAAEDDGAAAAAAVVVAAAAASAGSGRPFTVTEAAAEASRRLIADADISV